MRDINKVILLGRLGTDPIQRYTPNGTVVVNFPVATSWKIKGRSSEKMDSDNGAVPGAIQDNDEQLGSSSIAEMPEEFTDSDPKPNSFSENTQKKEESPHHSERTQWHRVVAWGKLGEICSKYLKKGSPVYLEGSIRSHSYTGRDGHPHVAFEVYLEDISFLGKPKTEVAVLDERLDQYPNGA